jgi:ATP-binding cassette, subfamily F, member 3
MLVAQVESVSVSYGARKILDGVSWSIMDGEKIGLVGPNGAGKSTLLRIMSGLATPDEGERTLRRGAKVVYLPQEFTDDSPTTTVLSEVIRGREDLLAIELELEQVEQAIADPDSAADMDAFTRLLDRQAELLEQFESSGGPRFRSDAQSMLQRLGIDESAFEKPVTLLSGGQRKLVGLARCLIQEPDLLLLDEPDNHLDVTGKERLEHVVRSFSGAVIVISHDRYLLDETISKVIELDQASLTVYEGNYSAFVKQRELALLKQQQDFVSQQKEIQRLEEAITRFKQWASQVVDKRHIRQAWNKQRMIDRMDKVDRPVLERRKIGLAFQASIRGGQKIVEARRIARMFGDDIILLDTSFTVMRGDRVGIIGPNGAGKSVLLRAILGEEPVDDGEVWVGPSVRFGHYAQGHETLDEKLTPVQFIRARHALRDDQVIANLGRFLFNARQCTEPIRNLSGGEKARLQMVELMLGGANCLLLDEPTNHLDIESIEVLEGALEQFDGTVIAVSHDRYFLDRICTRIFEVRDGDLTQYPGGYSEYARSQEAVGRPA